MQRVNVSKLYGHEVQAEIASHRILVVQENVPIREEICTAFSRDPLVLIAVGAVSEAASLLDVNAHRFSAAIVDLAFHGLVTDACLRMLEQHEIPAIVLTAVSPAETELLCLRRRPHAYLMVPASAEELRITMRGALVRSGLSTLPRREWTTSKGRPRGIRIHGAEMRRARERRGFVPRKSWRPGGSGRRHRGAGRTG